VRGKSLAEMISGDGLALERFFQIALPLVDALCSAHEAGITHRDLKPENVMVGEEGRLKVLDFGLAKLRQEVSTADAKTVSAEKLTQEGRILGTVPYMSPEQVQGDPVDHRSDVFSVGVILYEMMTGQRPFQGRASVLLLSSILKDTPRPVTELNAELPRQAERMVNRCLEKRPDRRFQAMLDLRNELEELKRETAEQVRPSPTRTASTAARTRLAVLPFENLSGDADQDFFVDGMHEEVVATLAGIRGLEVISRTSVRHYKDAASTLPEIARELRVDSIVEGSVRTSGSQVRITMQLIEASTDRHLWAHSYQQELRDVLTLQGAVAKAIAREVKAALTPEEEVQLGRARQVDPESYHAYLKGRHHWNKRTPEAINQAGKFFQAAIDADPTYAMAYAGLADCHLMRGAAFYASQDPREAYPRARSAAQKAIELDPTLAEPHASLGYLKTFFDWDWNSAEDEFMRAIELNPGYPTARLWHSLFLVFMKRHDEAIAAVDRALELDPLSLISIADRGWAFYHARKYDEAIEQYGKALELDRNFAVAHWGMGLANEQRGRPDEAAANMRAAVELASDNAVYHAALARALALSGKKDEATQTLETLLENRRGRRFVPSADMVFAYVGMGKIDEALRSLDKAYDNKENLMAMLNVDPRLDPLRSNPRFGDLLQRMNFPT
jgi:TolB-like protein/Tfp pilus assembly protein PilF